MWMVGYNNEGGEFNMVDLDHSFNGRKHRPLMPTPITSPSTITPPSLSHIHANNFFSPYHYHHLATVAEQNKREQCNAQPVVNHKARERQKRRRQMESSSADQGQQHHDFDTPEKKDLAANRTVFEVEQTKNWAPSTNCSTLAEV
ncbi:putative WUSCHEL-related homeobox 1-like isoform X3 [Sesbania bispinosa]|nr:putative WUSCHEL-related homeobox 1-like isoform X3 [Sesbania bispinosa]